MKIGLLLFEVFKILILIGIAIELDAIVQVLVLINSNL